MIKVKIKEIKKRCALLRHWKKIDFKNKFCFEKILITVKLRHPNNTFFFFFVFNQD